MHDLRRTAARDRVDDGTPERVVMAMTGHRTRAMFDRYSIASTKDIEAALRKSGAASGKAGRSAGSPIEPSSNRCSGPRSESKAPKTLEILGADWLRGSDLNRRPLIGHRFQNPCDGMRNARLKREDAFSHAMIIVSSAMVSSS